MSGLCVRVANSPGATAWMPGRWYAVGWAHCQQCSMHSMPCCRAGLQMRSNYEGC